MRKWSAQFILKPICEAIAGFRGELVFSDYKLWFDDKKWVFHGEVSKELDVEEPDKARKILAECIEQELLPYLIVVTGCGILFNPDNMSLRYEEPGTIGIVVSNVVRVHVVAEVKRALEEFRKELELYIDTAKGLDDIKRGWFLRALRFWNKGAIDEDPIDKFIDIYIALEIFAKRILGYSDLNEHVLNELENKYSISFKYKINNKEWNVCDIRNHLLHGGACSAEKVKILDEAIEAANKISNRFKRDTLDLFKRYLKQLSNY